MTNYELDDQEHTTGRWLVVLNGAVMTRYWNQKAAEKAVGKLRRKCYGRNAEVIDSQN